MKEKSLTDLPLGCSIPIVLFVGIFTIFIWTIAFVDLSETYNVVFHTQKSENEKPMISLNNLGDFYDYSDVKYFLKTELDADKVGGYFNEIEIGRDFFGEKYRKVFVVENIVKLPAKATVVGYKDSNDNKIFKTFEGDDANKRFIALIKINDKVYELNPYRFTNKVFEIGEEILIYK